MKFYPEPNHTDDVYGKALHPDLQRTLEEFRFERNFDAQAYVEEKTALIGTYFSEYGLDTAVVGVSGGIDSAVVAALLKRAADRPDNSLERVIPLLLPSLNNEGATGQSETVMRGEELCKSLNIKPNTFPVLAQLVHTAASTMEGLLGEEESAWGRGQLVAYQRTPLLYYATTLSTNSGHPALVVGTTNFSEGGYIGYIGKASDGMVDLQVISDLHKAEVFAVARYLGVPESILNVTPSGDMYDGRIDEEVFGASYDFVELYTHWLMIDGADRSKIYDGLSDEAKEQFLTLSDRIESLHRYNKHKYLGGSPAVHLDILPAKVPGGWKNIPWSINNA